MCCCLAAALTSCSEDKLSEQSVITVDQQEYTAFDYWLQRNYVAPYNIRFKYRYEDIESDMNYYTVPSRYEDAVKLAHLVKYLCIEAYDEVGGIDFTRAYFPKLIFTIGEWEYRNNGTYILGTAEGGRKILLSGTNYLDQYLKSAEDMNEYYLKTIHHEFTHILNQTRDYPAGFREVTGTTYVADSWSAAPYNVGSVTRGYISNYAQHSSGEDFAEMVSMYVTHDEAWWQGMLAAGNADGANGGDLLLTKLDYVKKYMKDTFDIDLDLLRAVVLRRQQEVIDGKVDLADLTIN